MHQINLDVASSNNIEIAAIYPILLLLRVVLSSGCSNDHVSIILAHIVGMRIDSISDADNDCGFMSATSPSCFAPNGRQKCRNTERSCCTTISLASDKSFTDMAIFE
eukprot:111742_1